MFRVLMQMLFYGRYGFDKLNRVLLVAGLLAQLAAMLWRGGALAWPLQVAGWLLMAGAVFRMFSRNIVARQAEARRFDLMLRGWRKRWQRVRYNWPRLFNGEYWRERRQYKFLRCPRCAARLRLPRGKGRMIATCPRCGHKMETKT